MTGDRSEALWHATIPQVLADTVARVVVAPAELPVGIITALLGGPFFLWLLVRRRHYASFGGTGR